MATQEKSDALIAEASLGAAAAVPLCAALNERRGTPVAIDASNVTHLGGSALQVLLAAQKSWATDGLAFDVIKPSDAILRDLAILGCTEHFRLNQDDPQ